MSHDITVACKLLVAEISDKPRAVIICRCKRHDSFVIRRMWRLLLTEASGPIFLLFSISSWQCALCLLPCAVATASVSVQAYVYATAMHDNQAIKIELPPALSVLIERAAS